MKKIVALLGLSLSLTGCAGLNPNPGERSVDNAWAYGNYDRALPILRSCAERGEPWAQLRLGVAYEFGNGVDTNINTAIEWYKKAALQEGSGLWAEGYIVGAFGKAGYFSQKIDALIAQHNLATIYMKGTGIPPDLIKAYLLELNVSKESNGSFLFFCYAPDSQPMGISAKTISDTLATVEGKLTPEQKAKTQAQQNSESIRDIL